MQDPYFAAVLMLVASSTVSEKICS